MQAILRQMYLIYFLSHIRFGCSSLKYKPSLCSLVMLTHGLDHLLHVDTLTVDFSELEYAVWTVEKVKIVSRSFCFLLRLNEWYLDTFNFQYFSKLAFNLWFLKTMINFCWNHGGSCIPYLNTLLETVFIAVIFLNLMFWRTCGLSGDPPSHSEE